jgi:hypothetical protein
MACAEPGRVPLTGGSVKCAHCQTMSTWRPLAHSVVAVAGDPATRVSEAERFRLLREQDGKDLTAPPALLKYLVSAKAGVMSEAATKRALADWNVKRQSVADGASFVASEGLYFLTLLKRRPREKASAVGRGARGDRGTSLPTSVARNVGSIGSENGGLSRRRKVDSALRSPF